MDGIVKRFIISSIYRYKRVYGTGSELVKIRHKISVDIRIFFYSV